MLNFPRHHRTVRRPASPNIKAGEDRAAGALDAMWMARGISGLGRGYPSPAPHIYFPPTSPAPAAQLLLLFLLPHLAGKKTVFSLE